MMIQGRMAQIMRQSAITKDINVSKAKSQNLEVSAIDKLGKKYALADAFEKSLEEAKMYDSVEYERLLREKKSFEAVLLSSIIDDGSGEVTYNGIQMNVLVEMDRKELQLGDMNEGRVISVYLSSDVQFKFNRDNMEDVPEVWDLFSAEDRNKIMDAIAIDNMIMKTEQEIEDAKGKLAKEQESESDDTP